MSTARDVTGSALCLRVRVSSQTPLHHFPIRRNWSGFLWVKFRNKKTLQRSRWRCESRSFLSFLPARKHIKEETRVEQNERVLKWSTLYLCCSLGQKTGHRVCFINEARERPDHMPRSHIGDELKFLWTADDHQ